MYLERLERILELAIGVAQQLLEPLGIIDVVRDDIPVPDAITRTANRKVEAFFALPQGPCPLLQPTHAQAERFALGEQAADLAVLGRDVLDDHERELSLFVPAAHGDPLFHGARAVGGSFQPTAETFQ